MHSEGERHGIEKTSHLPVHEVCCQEPQAHVVSGAGYVALEEEGCFRLEGLEDIFIPFKSPNSLHAPRATTLQGLLEEEVPGLLVLLLLVGLLQLLQVGDQSV